MRLAHSLPRRRDAFTLIELLVVMVLILVLAALGLGYIVFGQDNQHSVSGAQALTGALLNAKQRARRDGLPTGVRIVFGPTTQSPNVPATQASQLQLIQEPEPFNAGACTSGDGSTANPLTFSGVDFVGGAAFPGEIDESTVQAGDYFVPGATTTPHLITKVVNATSLTLFSPVVPAFPLGSSVSYTIFRAPRRLPSEDIIQMPSSIVIENSLITGQPLPSTRTFCQNLPQRTLTDFPPPPYSGLLPRTQTAAEITFAPSGAVVGQGTGADKVYLWLRDPNTKPAAFVTGQPYPGVPLILSVQIRTGLIGVYPLAPWQYNTAIGSGNDPYAYVSDPRSSGL